MIRGIGTDIVRIERFTSWLDDRKKIDRYFHSSEIEWCLDGAENPAASLAARFAAREAFGKALGSGVAKFALKEVWVERGELGMPILRTTGKAAEQCRALGIEHIHLSLAHERDYAVAMVVVE